MKALLSGTEISACVGRYAARSRFDCAKAPSMTGRNACATVLAAIAFFAPPVNAQTTRRGSPPENLIQVSWGDQIIVAHGDTALDTPDKIRRAVDGWKRHNDAGTILWRGSSYELERYFKWNKSNIPAYESRVATIVARGDPIAVAKSRAHENGQKLFMYLTFQDHGAPPTERYGDGPFPWQDRLTVEHPELQTVDLRGTYHHGVLEFAYPEARKAIIDRLKSLVDEFKVDGLYLCSRTHSPAALHADQFGFSPPIVAEMKRRFDIDIQADPRFDYRSPSYSPNDPRLENWRKVRGEGWTQFYRELRAAMGDKPIYAGIPRGRYFGPPYGNVYLDWETFLKERLVDGLVLKVNTGRSISGKSRTPHAEFGYRSSEDDELNVPTMEQSAATYGPAAKATGVKLFYNSTFYAPRQLARLDALPDLDGLMLWSPSREANRGRIPHDDAFNAPGGAMTIAMNLWLSDPRPHGFQRVLSKNDGDVDATKGWEVIVLGDGKLQFKVAQRDGTTGDVGEVSINTAEALPTKRWVTAACTFDRATQRLAISIDGKTVGERTVPDRPLNVNPEQPVCVGYNGGWTWHPFDGQIDDLRFIVSASADATPFAVYRFDALDGGHVANAFDATRSPIVLEEPTSTPLVGRDGGGMARDLRLAPQE